MQAAGVPRLVVQSTYGLGATRQHLPFFVRYFIIPFYLARAFADHAEQEAVVHASDLDWTIVCPPFLTDGPVLGSLRHDLVGDPSVRWQASREDVAAFLVAQLADPRWVRETVGVSS